MNTEQQISFDVQFDDQIVIENAIISMTMDKGRVLGVDPIVKDVKIEAKVPLIVEGE